MMDLLEADGEAEAQVLAALQRCGRVHQDARVGSGASGSGLDFKAALNRDYPLIQICFLVIACGYIIINLLVDYLVTLADPRVQEAI